MMAGMTRDQVKEILDRVLRLPAERQADVAHMVEMMEAQDRSTLHLTDEQLAEVRRRRAEKNPKTITLAELNARLRQRYGV
jgi:DNA-binding transcriptional MerR regulator